MTSYYALHRHLSEETLDAYTHYNDSIRDRLHFYYFYLEDVVPYGVTVHHIPSATPRYPHHENTRQEFELRTPTGRIFMHGLVSMENGAGRIERVAGDEAYTKNLDGYFARDDGTWRFFTGLKQMRVYCGFGGDSWELMSLMHPIDDVREVVGYFQDQFDSMRNH